MDEIITISALGDNYIYLYQYNNTNTLVIDPGDYSSVLEAHTKHHLTLTMILATHHHWDHIGGIAQLKKKTGCKVASPDKQRIPSTDLPVEDGHILTFGDKQIHVIATPGHTRTAVCYYLQPSSENEAGVVWTGDTLFIGGCGRLLDCHAQTMWDSLQKLAALPDRTYLYCGHDYTLENYEFAQMIEPENQTIKNRLNEIRQAQQQGNPTVPSMMAQEKATNIFLRANTPEVKAALKMPQAADVEVFAELRRRKDIF
jgi:hydroxyacylglutathione hydrolase